MNARTTFPAPARGDRAGRGRGRAGFLAPSAHAQWEGRLRSGKGACAAGTWASRALFSRPGRHWCDTGPAPVRLPLPLPPAMAASALLRLGRAGPLKTVQLEAWGFRDFAPTVSIRAKSENSKKDRLPEETKKQRAPKKPETAAEPPEPFDNSTYKNLQRHQYTAFTFLDFNLDLSKFRLPQPSSGKESPRH
uniref:Uncharacterized protein n=1 Tax=Ornithorhynchus anatinus TaxID=9258 RepID=F6R4D9_ORNAN